MEVERANYMRMLLRREIAKECAINALLDTLIDVKLTDAERYIKLQRLIEDLTHGR